MRVKTVIFGKKVRKPADIVDAVEFEDYALEPVERRVNDFIAEHELTREDILTYKVRTKKGNERIKREIKGCKQIYENVDYLNVRIYLSYLCGDSLDEG